MFAPWKKIYDQPRQNIKKQRHYLANKGPFNQSYVFFPVVMYGWLCMDESWTIKKAEHKNWSFWTVVLEETLESPLDGKELKPVNPKGNQSWISLEGLMMKLKLQYFGHLMWRSDSFEKTLRLGKIEGRRRRGRQRMMVGWHHWLNGHEFGWTLGVGDEQGGLACCSSWGRKESDTTELLNWTELNWKSSYNLNEQETWLFHNRGNTNG